jgi:curved DNA-binding protein CbpA
MAWQRAPDHYAQLGLHRSASEGEVKSAFRALALAHHPDLNAGDASAEARFKTCNEAYAVLSDAQARRDYDELHRYAGLSAPASAAGGGGWSSSSAGASRARAAAARSGSSGSGGAGSSSSSAGSASSQDWRDHMDFEEWSRAHREQTAAEREAFAKARRKEAAAGGFSAFNDDQANEHQNWEGRRSARAAWASAAAAGSADKGASELRQYRAWAGEWRQARAARERALPFTFLALSLGVFVAYKAIHTVTKSPGRG